MPAIRVQLRTSGNTAHVPVRVSVLSSKLEELTAEWQYSGAIRSFQVPFGICTVRAEFPSGVKRQQTLDASEDADCVLDFRAASPHESNASTYYTQPIDSLGKNRFHHRRYRGAWVMGWHKDSSTSLHRQDMVANTQIHNYGIMMNPERIGLYALQIGGPNVPSKFTLLPSRTHNILIRPSGRPFQAGHPVEIIPATISLQDSLFALLRRNEIAFAKEYLEFSKSTSISRGLAEQYCDLRIGTSSGVIADANDFGKESDEFIYGQDSNDLFLIRVISRLKKNHTDKFRREFLDSGIDLVSIIHHRLPVYSEGFNLLWKYMTGIFCSPEYTGHAGGSLAQESSTSRLLNNYYASCDMTLPCTNYLGVNINSPDIVPTNQTWPPTVPRDYWNPKARFIYDVPLDIAVALRVLKTNSIISIKNDPVRGRIRRGGRIVLDDGRRFSDLHALADSLGDPDLSDQKRWYDPDSGRSLFDLTQPLRIGGR